MDAPVVGAHDFSSPLSLLAPLHPFMCFLLPTAIFLGFPCGSADKESICNMGDLGWIPGLGRSPGEGKGCPLQCSCLENSMDCIPCGRKESDTTERLSLARSTETRVSLLSYQQVPAEACTHRTSVRSVWSHKKSFPRWE